MSQCVLAHRAVKSKGNEISAAAALLHPALVKGRIVSTDALHTQRAWCMRVHLAEGYYLSIVKGNQPTLYEDIHDFFDDPDGGVLALMDWSQVRNMASQGGISAHILTTLYICCVMSYHGTTGKPKSPGGRCDSYSLSKKFVIL